MLENISQITQCVWQKLSLFLQEYKQHIHASDFAEWEEKRLELFHQFAPLLDRVGRLTADASMILQSDLTYRESRYKVDK